VPFINIPTYGDYVLIDGYEFYFSRSYIGIKPEEVIDIAFANALMMAQKMYPTFLVIFNALESPHSTNTWEYYLGIKDARTLDYPQTKLREHLEEEWKLLRHYYPNREGKSPPKKKKPQKGYVYLLQSPTEAYKIGRTKAPQDRIKTFGVKMPFEVEYIALIKTDDMVKLEVNLHNKFTDKRIDGEWFELSLEDVEYIKSLADE
jgi:hypothetical protein